MEPDARLAIMYLEIAAEENGYSKAQSLLGKFYLKGVQDHVVQDVERGLLLLASAAQQGDAEGMQYLQEVAKQGDTAAKRY